MNLRELYLDFNCIARLPESFGYLASLEVLFLNENRLTALPRSFHRLQKLRKLNLQRNSIQAVLEVSAFANLSDVYVDDPKTAKQGLVSAVAGPRPGGTGSHPPAPGAPRATGRPRVSARAGERAHVPD